MVNLPLIDKNGKSLGEIKASDSLFAVAVKPSVLNDAVRWYLSGKRQGTASTKTRAEVRGGGKKPWKQKGTGRARAGSIRSPLWRKGGVVFGPKPRDYSFQLPKKVRELSFKMALSGKAGSGKVVVIDSLELKSGKTSEMAKIMGKIKKENAYVVLGAPDTNIKRASANIEKVKVSDSKNALVFDILKYEWLLLDQAALSNLEERFKG